MSADGQWLLNHASGMYTPDFSPDSRYSNSRAASTTQWVMQSTEDAPAPMSQNSSTDSAPDEERDVDLLGAVKFLDRRLNNYRKGHRNNLKHMKEWQNQMTEELESLQSVQDQLFTDIQSVKSSQGQVLTKIKWLESHLGNISAGSQVARAQENEARAKSSQLAHGQTTSDVESLRLVVDKMASSIETLTAQYNHMAERMKILGTSVDKHGKEIDSLQVWSDQTVNFLDRSLRAIRDLDSRVCGRTKDEE